MNSVPKTILSISYDESLLETRRLLLEMLGFNVISSLGFVDSLKRCEASADVDLIILGHSIPHNDKMTLFSAIKKNCRAPILSIVRHSEDPLPGVDYYVSSQDGPTALLDMVKCVAAKSKVGS